MAGLAARHALSRNFLLALALAGLLIAGPAGVTLAGPPRTGDQISLVNPPETFEADTAFWIGHGWCLTQEELDDGVVDSPTDVVRQHSRFELFIDDVAVPLATDLKLNVDSCIVQKINFHNFRVGLPAGVHTFRGEFFLSGEDFDTLSAEIVFE